MRSGRREKLRPDRVAADERLRSEKRLRRVERHRRRPHEPRQQPIGQPRHRVLLEQHRRHAAQRRDEHHRARAVAADADHQLRPPRRDDAPARRAGRAAPAPRRAARSSSDLPFSPPLRIRSSAKPSRGTTRASMPLRRAGERDLARPAAAPAARAPRRCPDTDVRRCRRRQSRRAAVSMAIAAVMPRTTRAATRSAECPCPRRLISSDDPPALTNGSGMPLVGISPSTTLMLTNACTATIVVSPSARNDAERVRRAQRDAQAAPGDDAEADQHQRSRRSARAPRRSPSR